MDSLNHKRFKKYVQQVTTIKLPFTFESLQQTAEDISQLEKICEDTLGPDRTPQCMSARFVDSEGKPILYYFGDRLELPEGSPAVSNNPPL